MSKQRAVRRAEREARQRTEREKAARASARRARWGSLVPRVRRRRGGSLLAAQRRRQNGVLIAFLLAGHVALWVATDSWWWRIGLLLFTVLLWPLLVTVVFDRRGSR
ncbi:MAG TPA: hypothetical protein VFD41_11890 [Actinomycetales bacterium]|nr:hypothetical protein [Actinomycetales bacterium]